MSDLARRLATIKEKLRNSTMRPPLTEAAVLGFEAERKVVLPEEYRRFILEIANGGRGPPDYGLVPLGELPDDYGSGGAQRFLRLTRSFPLTVPWVWEGEELTDECEERIESATLDGSLVLGTDGCGMYWHLVVSGPERGQVWLITGEGASPCQPRRTFLSWYEDWLFEESRTRQV